jgi:electron transfer flavoprotein alpha subunit
MAGNVWVLAEQWNGRISDITYEVLALGRETANALGVNLEAVLLGYQAREHAAALGCAERVLYADHPTLAEPTPEPYCEALRQMLIERAPQVVLIPLTNVTLGVGTLLGARLQAPVVNFCCDLSVLDGELRARCLLYGGKIEATVLVIRQPAIFGVWPGSRPAEKGKADSPPVVEEVTVHLPEVPCVRFKRYVQPEAGEVDISQQDVLVAVGRGIQSQDNLDLADELAKALGGAVCGSRPVIDQGWLPLSRQVGKSGLNVKPKVYLAAGISGAPEHVEGIRNAGLVVAINTDPQAPIFNVARYGIVADALDVLPALTEAVRARKG